MKPEDVMPWVGLALIIAPFICAGVCLIIFAPWQVTTAIFCMASLFLGIALMEGLK